MLYNPVDYLFVLLQYFVRDPSRDVWTGSRNFYLIVKQLILVFLIL
jgi:hypothetical protein